MEPLVIAFIIGIVLSLYLLGRIAFALIKVTFWLAMKLLSVAFYVCLGLVVLILCSLFFLPTLFGGITVGVIHSVFSAVSALPGGSYFGGWRMRLLPRI